jgi:hypothetical protein
MAAEAGAYGAICRSESRNRGVVAPGCEVRNRLVNSELNPQRQSLAEAAQFLQSELATWSRMVGAIGLKLK